VERGSESYFRINSFRTNCGLPAVRQIRLAILLIPGVLTPGCRNEAWFRSEERRNISFRQPGVAATGRFRQRGVTYTPKIGVVETAIDYFHRKFLSAIYERVLELSTWKFSECKRFKPSFKLDLQCEVKCCLGKFFTFLLTEPMKFQPFFHEPTQS
jgi:hypothetical protein